MAIHKLDLGEFDEIDYDLIAIHTSLEDFRMAFFINQILETSLKSTSIAGEEAGSDIIKGMYLQSISDSSSGNFGISDMLYNFLSQNNKKEQG